VISGRSFVVFSDDWGRHPSSCQHLFRRLALRNRVLWVNTIGTRTPTLSRADLARAAGKLREWTMRPDSSGDDEPAPVEILRPLMTPFDRLRPLRLLNATILTRAVNRALRLGAHDPPILVTTIPNAAGVVGSVGEALSVYYCVDEFSEWPGSDRTAMLEMEGELLRRVDLVVTTSDALFHAKSASHARVRLLPHGVDWQRFREGAGRSPAALDALPRPRIGYAGLVDERLDAELLTALATARRDMQWVLLGPRQLPPSGLDQLPNVHFLPAVPYEDVPAVLAALDVAMLPYVESDLTERMNPLKLRELLASGTPVVATPLREVKRFAAEVALARGPDEWLAQVDAALKEGRSGAAARAERVRPEGWDARAEEFSRFLADAEAQAGAAR
jgi:glycosyltransferase involved in cell wall biosynthesis